MQTVVIPLEIPADRWVAYYRGEIRAVVATSMDGRRIQLPARVLQPFVTPEGILGVFRVRFDARHRFVDIERLAGPVSSGGRLA